MSYKKLEQAKVLEQVKQRVITQAAEDLSDCIRSISELMLACGSMQFAVCVTIADNNNAGKILEICITLEANIKTPVGIN